MTYRSYAGGASLTTEAAYKQPIVAVDPDWVFAHGGRAQRRRIAKALKQLAKSRRWQVGRK